MAKMNQVIKERWCAALESGEYAQAKRRLKVVEGYCCLGVLADLYNQDVNEAKQVSLTGGTLPEPVQNWAGLANKWGDYVKIDGTKCVLPGHNDGYTDGTVKPQTFKQIAAAIREQL